MIQLQIFTVFVCFVHVAAYSDLMPDAFFRSHRNRTVRTFVSIRWIRFIEFSLVEHDVWFFFETVADQLQQLLFDCARQFAASPLIQGEEKRRPKQAAKQYSIYMSPLFPPVILVNVQIAVSLRGDVAAAKLGIA